MTYTSCRDCHERHVGCHGTCQRYIAYHDEHERQLERIRKEKAVKSMIGSYAYEAKRRMMKRGHKRKGGCT